MRADRARCHKLSDAEVATAPIVEIRKVTHHQAVIGGRTITYTTATIPGSIRNWSTICPAMRRRPITIASPARRPI